MLARVARGEDLHRGQSDVGTLETYDALIRRKLVENCNGQLSITEAGARLVALRGVFA
jgi:hypothetical protein